MKTLLMGFLFLTLTSCATLHERLHRVGQAMQETGRTLGHSNSRQINCYTVGEPGSYSTTCY